MANVRHTMKHHPAVAFAAPYRLYLPTDFLDVLVDEQLARVKAVPLPTEAAQGATQVHGSIVEIKHDIFGFAGRTQFYIVLSEEIDISSSEWKQLICQRDQELVEAALGVVNRLLSVYRDQDINKIGVSSFHVIELVRGDLSDISLVVVDDELRQITDFAITWPGFHSMGFGSAVERDSSVVQAIRDYLASGTEITIERELLSSARNHLWRRQLRLVPIEANTAFEGFSYSALLRASPTTQLPDTSELFRKLQELEVVFSNAATQGSIQFSRWFDPAIAGWKGLEDPVLTQWYISCYKLRNRVIHRGYNGVTSAEAEASLDVTEQAISMIEQCVAGLPS